MPEKARNLVVRDRMPRSWALDRDENDIFCMVKSTMASKSLCQDPLLVWPTHLETTTRRAFEVANSQGCPTQICSVDDARISELRDLQAALRRDFPLMRRTVAWYQTMIDGPPDRVERLAPLTFLRDARSHRPDLNFRLSQRAPGPRPHELQVVFHRNRWGRLGVQTDANGENN